MSIKDPDCHSKTATRQVLENSICDTCTSNVNLLYSLTELFCKEQIITAVYKLRKVSPLGEAKREPV